MSPVTIHPLTCDFLLLNELTTGFTSHATQNIGHFRDKFLTANLLTL